MREIFVDNGLNVVGGGIVSAPKRADIADFEAYVTAKKNSERRRKMAIQQRRKKKVAAAIKMAAKVSLLSVAGVATLQTIGNVNTVNNYEYLTEGFGINQESNGHYIINEGDKVVDTDYAIHTIVERAKADSVPIVSQYILLSNYFDKNVATEYLGEFKESEIMAAKFEAASNTISKGVSK